MKRIVKVQFFCKWEKFKSLLYFNQENHHKKQTFNEEYHQFLKAFEIDYNERYIFKDLI